MGLLLIIAYSLCEEHGYDLAFSYDQMCQFIAIGFWLLYCFDLRCADEGKLLLALDLCLLLEALEEMLLYEQCFCWLNLQQLEVAE